jgi:hypothetical protein
MAALNNFGDLAEEEGDFTAARQYYDRVLPTSKRIFGEKGSEERNARLL